MSNLYNFVENKTKIHIKINLRTVTSPVLKNENIIFFLFEGGYHIPNKKNKKTCNNSKYNSQDSINSGLTP